MIVVLGQYPDQNFTDPPPLPEKGMFLLSGMYEEHCAHIVWCDLPLIQNSKVCGIYKFHLQLPCWIHNYSVSINSPKIVPYKNIYVTTLILAVGRYGKVGQLRFF